MRRFLTQLNLAVTLVVLGVLFILINFVASRRYLRSDLTKNKITQLSGKTVQVLTQLKDPVNVVVFYQPNHRLYELVRDLLTEYERVTQKLAIEYVDPEQDIARAQQLAKQFEIERLNLVIFESGTRHKYLSDTDLAEYDYSTMAFGGQPSVKSFKGEDAFTSTIVSVTQTTQPLVWMTSGHGEKRIDDVDPMGLSELKKALEQENMRVEAVTLLEKAEIPNTVGAMVIPGPTRRFVEQELVLLETYLEGGGRLLALIDPMQDTGLDWVLAKWGIEVGNDIVVDPARQLPFVSAANLFVTTYSQHPIVEKMQTLMTLFPLTRSVRPAKDLGGMTATALAMTSPEGWGETQVTSKPFEFNEGQDTKGPVSIATASEKTASTPPRVVAIGDSDFVANAQLGNVGNRDFILGSLHWLAAQEQLIGIGPKPLESIKLNLTAAQLRGIFWSSFALLPFLCALAGVGMWWIRRK